MALKQHLSQKLLQKLSPQQIQLMKLLQVPTIAIEARIKEELEKNPALDEGRDEEDDEFAEQDDQYDDSLPEQTEAEKDFDFSEYIDDEPSYKYSISNKGVDEEERTTPVTTGKSFRERLEDQLDMQDLEEQEYFIADYLLGSLDDSGYLRRDSSAVVDDLAFTQNINTDEKTVERILKIIQTFDPPGTGARDLQECLLIQLNRKTTRTVESITAKAIIEDYFEAYIKKHYKKILEGLEIDEAALKAADEEIKKLNPKPGGSGSDSRSSQVVIPDFILTLNEDDELELSLNSRNAPELRVSKKYSGLIEDYQKGSGKATKQQKDTLTFVKQKLDSAKWFIDAIKQRQQTLLLTMQTIIDHQKEYFMTGDETKLKPMILKDIADVINMDISTVSRVANSKYIQTSYGTFILKSFFSESLTNSDGEEVSTREVKKILEEAIGNENKRKPLTDQALVAVLKDKGYNIARRTVAKYREQLNIPVARLRKEL
ncbi:MAG: RNA polymerase sigma-54 factor [Crocinitomicaceae bacterium]|nr:RNA polymerase sigma-54 factor [Crocinitomicaceae bacterium]|tara:strand:- start:10929 stop:12389 length:1461 start_codon:yes stop_codon:yes gene_type:complete